MKVIGVIAMLIAATTVGYIAGVHDEKGELKQKARTALVEQQQR